jgi:hypothetical protein
MFWILACACISWLYWPFRARARSSLDISLSCTWLVSTACATFSVAFTFAILFSPFRVKLIQRFLLFHRHLRINKLYYHQYRSRLPFLRYRIGSLLYRPLARLIAQGILDKSLQFLQTSYRLSLRWRV